MERGCRTVTLSANPLAASHRTAAPWHHSSHMHTLSQLQTSWPSYCTEISICNSHEGQSISKIIQVAPLYCRLALLIYMHPEQRGVLISGIVTYNSEQSEVSIYSGLIEGCMASLRVSKTLFLVGTTTLALSTGASVSDMRGLQIYSLAGLDSPRWSMFV